MLSNEIMHRLHKPINWVTNNENSEELKLQPQYVYPPW